MTLYAATSNKGKLVEFATSASTSGITVEALPNLASLPEPIEDARTFMSNAEKKAIEYSRAAPGLLVFADDSVKTMTFERLGHQIAFLRCGMYGGPNGGTPDGDLWHGMAVATGAETVVHAQTFDVTDPAVRSRLAGSHSSLGLLLSDTDKPKEAEEALRKAIALAPDHAQAYTNLGIALAQTGEMGDAMAQLESAIQQDPRSAYAHHALGALLAQQGQTIQAAAEFTTVLEIDPSHAQARLIHGRDVGGRFHPLRISDGIAADGAGAHLGDGVGEPIDDHVDLAGDEVVHRRTRTAIRHILQLDAGDVFEIEPGDVTARSGARGADRRRLRPRLQPSQQFRQ